MTDIQAQPQCNSCLQPFQGTGEGIPRILPCAHRFCQACLSHVLNTRAGSKRMLKCPQCSSLVSVPSGGVSAFSSDPGYTAVPIKPSVEVKKTKKTRLSGRRCKAHPSALSSLSARTLCRARQNQAPRKRKTMKTTLKTAWATLKPAFLSSGHCYRDFSTSSRDVQSMCLLKDGSAWVARKMNESRGRALLYSQQGNLVRSSPVHGRVSLALVAEDEVYVEGRDHFVQKLLSDETKAVDYDGDDDILCDLYCKGTLRFSIDFPTIPEAHTRLCKWELSGKREDLWVNGGPVKTWNSLKKPVAMDASKSGRLFAVVDEAVDKVFLFRDSATDPCDQYAGDGQSPFKPRDVCFVSLRGQEMLVVADWLNCSLHVLKVRPRNGYCVLLGYLGDGSAALRTHRPTSLTVDEKSGQLWVGCESGHVFTLDLDSD